MTVKSKFYGWDIQFSENNEWVFSDNLEPTVTTHHKRPCGYCMKFKTEEDHDACISNLPDVLNACCGHGVIEDAYIQLTSGSIIRGGDVEDYLKQLRS